MQMHFYSAEKINSVILILFYFTGLMPIADLILRVENACRNVSESIRFVCY